MASERLYVSGWGFKGENYGEGRWTQTQLHTGGEDKGEQKTSFILKLIPKIKSKQNGGKRQSSN